MIGRGPPVLMLGGLALHSNVANVDGAVATLVGTALAIATHETKAAQLAAC